MGPPKNVQQPLDAVVERRLLLNVILEHLPVLEADGLGEVFKNARFMNVSIPGSGARHGHPPRHLRLRPRQQG